MTAHCSSSGTLVSSSLRWEISQFPVTTSAPCFISIVFLGEALSVQTCDSHIVGSRALPVMRSVRVSESRRLLL